MCHQQHKNHVKCLNIVFVTVSVIIFVFVIVFVICFIVLAIVFFVVLAIVFVVVIAFVNVFVFVFLLVRSRLPITFIKRVKSHKSIGILSGSLFNNGWSLSQSHT